LLTHDARVFAYAPLSSAGSELQRQTNTEPGAVATGSSNNKLICNGHGPGRSGFCISECFPN